MVLSGRAKMWDLDDLKSPESRTDLVNHSRVSVIISWTQYPWFGEGSREMASWLVILCLERTRGNPLWEEVKG